jgi:hypothetical protein
MGLIRDGGHFNQEPSFINNSDAAAIRGCIHRKYFHGIKSLPMTQGWSI